ncbi:hypothetical protein GALMADRAFT_262056 [Galerina marginata CBS 339.88]|uniref:BTB domain-containing protein n=1 Tax=Galerina marginata (strain CBS 339.88) TaxID=685588 RepID=A0A067TKJ6_GALM3|nr:hypothetical protein GALMADRAFT_262056 [Galerina marginata CBS 339.88]
MSTITSTAMPPRSLPRPSHTPSPSSSQSTVLLPSSPSNSTHNPRRPSVSNTMHWLSRTTTQSSFTQPPHSPSKPVKISEPKRARTIDSISAPRNGTLGAGAIVVRTPDEALRETGVRLSPEVLEKETSRSQSRTSLDKKERKRPSTPTARKSDTTMTEPISPPTSPPLPPLPLPDADDTETLVDDGEGAGTKTPPRPNRAPPPPPLAQTLSRESRRSSLKGRSISTAEGAPTVPPLPPHVVASTQPAPFQALLVSEPPSVITDPSKVIVTLETCTVTYKTTLSTIHSRPSHLSNYLSSLFSQSDARSTASSRYSTESDDLAMYNRHLISQGLLPPSINIHLFLDRSSSPYAHVLSYLRAPVIEGQPEVLPRALQLHASTSTQSRLDNLIEVRDEAAFLNLEGLHKLCSDEIRLRYGPRVHTRGNSASSGTSIHSLHASIYSLHTLLERVEGDMANTITGSPETPLSTGTTVNGSKGQVCAQEAATVVSRSPPTPQSWQGPQEALEQRSQSRQSQRQSGQTPKSAPAGWI